jgi:hypothetical protein
MPSPSIKGIIGLFGTDNLPSTKVILSPVVGMMI